MAKGDLDPNLQRQMDEAGIKPDQLQGFGPDSSEPSDVHPMNQAANKAKRKKENPAKGTGYAGL